MIVRPTPAGLSLEISPEDLERMRRRAAYYNTLAASAIRRARDTLAAVGTAPGGEKGNTSNIISIPFRNEKKL